MADNATLNVPKDVLNPIIEAHVTKAILEALGGRDELVAKAVSFAMNVQVDGEGKPTSYNGQKWIVWAMTRSLQDAARDAIVQHLANNKPIIEKQLAEELRKHNSPVAKQLIAAITGAISSENTLRWGLAVTCSQRT